VSMCFDFTDCVRDQELDPEMPRGSRFQPRLIEKARVTWSLENGVPAPRAGTRVTPPRSSRSPVQIAADTVIAGVTAVPTVP